MKNAVTPFFKGDVKTGQNSFLSVPVSVEDLHSCEWSRNFWVAVNGAEPWSVTGVGTGYLGEDEISCSARITPGSFSVTRLNANLGLEAEVGVFAPEGSCALEVMLVTLRNTGSKRVSFQPTYCIPAYCRSADNLRSHRQLTSLLHRVSGLRHGFRIKPTMNFDERGHQLNATGYFISGFDGAGHPPVGGWASSEDFCGPRHGLLRPDAVFHRLAPRAFSAHFEDGREAVGALRFADANLDPGESAEYVIILAVSDKDELPEIDRLGVPGAAVKAKLATEERWHQLLDKVKLTTGESDFDQWFRWVQLQPFLRRLYGCSFMPDHDYGRGGRGWRDIWQDMLGLIMTDPAAARTDLVSFFSGIRWDGSNATIIGEKPGEFLSDRDGISRVWSDHGVWPWRTVKMYIDQTGDTGILFAMARYWQDRQIRRARNFDATWAPAHGTWQKDRDGRIVEGTVLEHILLQHYVAFFHVGEHNLLMLEGADWNDGIDMARTRGETVHFGAVYAGNMRTIADMLEQVRETDGTGAIALPAELKELMAFGQRPLYGNWKAKRQHLDRFFDAVTPNLSGKRETVALVQLIADLREKADDVFARTRSQEWLEAPGAGSFYNAYYDEQGMRVDGATADRGLQMNLAAQAMGLLAGLPDPAQVDAIIRSVNRILCQGITGLPALCTDTGGPYMALGRNFGYAYGNKENGAPFSHMVVMYAAGLAQNGRVAEAYRMLRLLYENCIASSRSRMFPGIPEYFEPDGRGVYCYLTGSAAWYVMVFITAILGVAARVGNLVISPNFAATGLTPADCIIRLPFAGRRLVIRFSGSGAAIAGISLNGKLREFPRDTDGNVVVPRSDFEALPADGVADLMVIFA